MGLDFQALSKNPERETIKSENIKRRKTRKSKSKNRSTLRQTALINENEQYCVIAHEELKVLLQNITEPEKFDFYEHLHEIGDKFPERQMDHIANYFNLLVTYIKKNKQPSMTSHLAQITVIRNHLNHWIKERREMGAKLTFNEEVLKPKSRGEDDDSIEDGVDDYEEELDQKEEERKRAHS